MGPSPELNHCSPQTTPHPQPPGPIFSQQELLVKPLWPYRESLGPAWQCHPPSHLHDVSELLYNLIFPALSCIATKMPKSGMIILIFHGSKVWQTNLPARFCKLHLATRTGAVNGVEQYCIWSQGDFASPGPGVPLQIPQATSWCTQ